MYDKLRSSAPPWFAFGALFIATLFPASAQVNTEALRASINTPNFSGSFDLNLGLKQGNTDSLDAGVGGRLQHVVRAESCPAAEGEVAAAEDFQTCFARRIFFVVGNYSVSENDDERDANESFLHGRWGHGFNARFAVEAFLQHEFNEFQRLDTRFLAGGGGRVALRRRKDLEAFVGFGLMFEFERLDLPVGSLEEEKVRNVRSTNYLTLRYTPPGRALRLVNTLYLQPRVDQPSDLRLLNEGEIQYDLGKNLSLGLALSVSYDAEAPADVKKTDLSLTNKLTYRF